MADFDWTARSPLAKALVAGRHGVAGTPGVRLREVRGFALFQVMARRGQAAAMAATALERFGAEPPARPGAVFAGPTTLLWSGADQFLALVAGSGAPGLAEVRESFAASASVVEQSDGRCLMRVSGPRARDVLAKLNSLDYHDSMFPVGAAATTSIDHTAVNVWRDPDGSDGPSYGLVTFATFAESLWHGLLEASAEFGAEVSAEELGQAAA